MGKIRVASKWPPRRRTAEHGFSIYKKGGSAFCIETQRRLCAFYCDQIFKMPLSPIRQAASRSTGSSCTSATHIARPTDQRPTPG